MMKDIITLKNVKTHASRFHPKVNHVFWLKRNGICPYCYGGSRPVPKACIVEME